MTHASHSSRDARVTSAVQKVERRRIKKKGSTARIDYTPFYVFGFLKKRIARCKRVYERKKKEKKTFRSGVGLKLHIVDGPPASNTISFGSLDRHLKSEDFRRHRARSLKVYCIIRTSLCSIYIYMYTHLVKLLTRDFVHDSRMCTATGRRRRRGWKKKKVKRLKGHRLRATTLARF